MNTRLQPLKIIQISLWIQDYNLSKSFKSAYEYKTTTSQNHSNKLMNTRLQPLKIIQISLWIYDYSNWDSQFKVILKSGLRLESNPFRIFSIPVHSMVYFGHMWPWFYDFSIWPD